MCACRWVTSCVLIAVVSELGVDRVRIAAGILIAAAGGWDATRILVVVGIVVPSSDLFFVTSRWDIVRTCIIVDVWIATASGLDITIDRITAAIFVIAASSWNIANIGIVARVLSVIAGIRSIGGVLTGFC